MTGVGGPCRYSGQLGAPVPVLLRKRSESRAASGQITESWATSLAEASRTPFAVCSLRPTVILFSSARICRSSSTASTCSSWAWYFADSVLPRVCSKWSRPSTLSTSGSLAFLECWGKVGAASGAVLRRAAHYRRYSVQRSWQCGAALWRLPAHPLSASSTTEWHGGADPDAMVVAQRSSRDFDDCFGFTCDPVKSHVAGGAANHAATQVADGLGYAHKRQLTVLGVTLEMDCNGTKFSVELHKTLHIKTLVLPMFTWAGGFRYYLCCRPEARGGLSTQKLAFFVTRPGASWPRSWDGSVTRRGRVCWQVSRTPSACM